MGKTDAFNSRCWFNDFICLVLTLLCFLWSGAMVSLAGDTHYVSLNGTNDVGHSYSNDWAGAATNIQWAVDVADSAAADTVLVSNGTYNLTNQISITKSITVRSLYGTNDINTRSIINGNNYVGKQVTNRCVSMTKGVLSGFTVSNGVLMDTATQTGGGGIYLTAGLVSNCFIYGNSYSNSNISCGGGGVFLNNDNAIVSHCSIIGNSCIGVDTFGGGVHVQRGLLTTSYISGNTATRGGGVGLMAFTTVGSFISNCVVAGNTAGSGGGVNLHVASRMINCVVSNNVATGNGGGVYSYCASDYKMSGSTIIGNVAANDGGGIYAHYCGVFVSNCQVIANTASNKYGGIYNYAILYGSGVIADSTIANNVSKSGAGMYMDGAGYYPELVRNCLIYGNTNLTGNCGGIVINATSNYPYGLINCTIVSNQSTTKGGGLYASGAANYIGNCIIYGNVTTNDNNDEVYNDTAANTNNYWYNCAPTNLVAGQGNTTNNPLFVDAGNRNYRLSRGSPGINTGTNMSWMTGAFDLDGRMRIRYGRVDMGAYEAIYSGTMYGFR